MIEKKLTEEEQKWLDKITRAVRLREYKKIRENIAAGKTSWKEIEEATKKWVKEELEANKKEFEATNYFKMGLSLFRMKHFKEALGSFQKALDINPDNPEYLNLIGQTYNELGKYKVAERYLRDSVEKNSDYAIGYYDLGVILAKSKARRKEAFWCFKIAVKLDPSIEWAYYTIACLYALEGNKEKALDYLKQSFERGLSNKKHIDSDSDMDSLREEKEFKKMLAQYLPKKKGGIKGLTLSIEGQPDIDAPRLDLLKALVDQMSSDDGPGFLILEGPGQDFTQVAGRDGVYSVEWREYSGDEYRHWVAGLPGLPSKKKVVIPTNRFQVTVRENERLGASDVKNVLASFAKGKGRPQQFVWRETTVNFPKIRLKSERVP